MTAPSDRARQLLTHQAATHAYLYAGAVKFEAQQLLAPDSAEKDHFEIADLVSAARQANALMLVLALRNVLRAAEMALRHADPPEAQNIKTALDRFKRAIPDLVQARDTLEHFDDYLAGKGRTSSVYDVTFERADGRYVISIGPARIDVQIALQEARHLSANAITAVWRDWGYPVGREMRVEDGQE